MGSQRRKCIWVGNLVFSFRVMAWFLLSAYYVPVVLPSDNVTDWEQGGGNDSLVSLYDRGLVSFDILGFAFLSLASSVDASFS